LHATPFAQAAPRRAAGQAPATAGQGEAFRPAIATPLQAAEQAIRAKKYDEALARIRDAEAVADRTPGENLAIERMRAIAASGAGDIPTATRSFETVINSGKVAPADQATMIQVVAQLYFQGKDYAKAATWAARSLKENGPNPDMLWLMVRAQYLAGDCASAARELRGMVDAETKGSTPPAQERLQMLATCSTKLGDDAGYTYAQDKFLLYYPSKELWADAIRRVESKPGFSDRLRLDVLRLRRATGTFEGTPAYSAMTQLAMTAALPAEAKKVADEGFSSGALGTGADAEAQKKAPRRGDEGGRRRRAAAPAKRESGRRGEGGHNARQRRLRVRDDGTVRHGHSIDGAGHRERRAAPASTTRSCTSESPISRPARRPKPSRHSRKSAAPTAPADLARLWLIQAQRPA
jgi:hypothetical protein